MVSSGLGLPLQLVIFCLLKAWEWNELLVAYQEAVKQYLNKK